MSRYIALLRGINVGGKRKILKPELVACFEQMGFSDVETVIQSGNVVFGSNKSNLGEMKSQIETELTARFSYPAKAFVYQSSFIKSIASSYPMNTVETDFQHYALFFETSSLSDEFFAQAGQLQSPADQVQPGEDEVVYWRVTKGQTLKSDVAKLLTRQPFKTSQTNRNIKTLLKIAASP